MLKACGLVAGALVSTGIGIMIQKADHVPGIWYAWILESPHVVPTIFLFAAALGLIALGQWSRVRNLYWRAFTAMFGPADSIGHNNQLLSKLKIHSAVYGTGPENDVDVADVLRQKIGDGLVLDVVNDSFPGDDPAHKETKRLAVEYSWSGARFKTERPEYSRLVLPEDIWLRNMADEATATRAKLSAVTIAPIVQVNRLGYNPDEIWLGQPFGNRYGIVFFGEVANVQMDADRIARNVRVKSRYNHADDAFTSDISPWMLTAAGFRSRVDLQRGESCGVVIAIRCASPTGFHCYAPEINVDNELSPGKYLRGGRWRIEMEILADNALSITLKASFQIAPTGDLVELRLES